MSLANSDGISDDSSSRTGASTLTSNGVVTPPRERDQPVAKKRRKAPLSPYHISKQHSPGECWTCQAHAMD